MKRTFIQTALVAALIVGPQGAYANGINSPSGVPVEIGAGGTQNILTITPSGQVGINNPTPSAGYMLDVNGDTKIGGNMNVTGATLLGPRHLQLGADTNRFGDSGLRIWNNGSSPGNDSAALTIMPNNGGTADIRLYNANDPTGLNLGTADIGFAGLSPSAALEFSLGHFGAGTAPTAFSFIGGPVGIGTTNPQATLDVNGGVRVGNSDDSCTPNNAGTIRWNGTAFEGCGGGDTWQPVQLQPDVQIASCAAYHHSDDTTPTNYYCKAQCPEGYVATGGGYDAGAVYSSAGRNLIPSVDGYTCDVNIKSCSSNPPSCGLTCYSTCVKL